VFFSVGISYYKLKNSFSFLSLFFSLETKKMSKRRNCDLNDDNFVYQDDFAEYDGIEYAESPSVPVVENGTLQISFNYRNIYIKIC
jgi:hypothetical protein